MLVKTAREMLDATQDEMAQFLGLGEGSKISRVEAGTRKPNGAEIFSFLVIKMLEPPDDEDPSKFISSDEIKEVLRAVPMERRSIITACMSLERFADQKRRGEAVDKTTGVSSSESNSDDPREVSVIGMKDHVADLKNRFRQRGEQVGGRAQDRYDTAAGLLSQVEELVDQAKREEERRRSMDSKS